MKKDYPEFEGFDELLSYRLDETIYVYRPGSSTHRISEAIVKGITLTSCEDSFGNKWIYKLEVICPDHIGSYGITYTGEPYTRQEIYTREFIIMKTRQELKKYVMDVIDREIG